MKNPQKTFQWIVSILRKQNIPFQVTGGLAAKSYGSPRELNDIDIDIPDQAIPAIEKEVREYITFGPACFRNERWDLLLMKLNHEGQDIDISGGTNLRICDARSQKWHEMPTDFSGEDSENRAVFDIEVPVISRKSLIEYKSMLEGNHQQVDIQACNETLPPAASLVRKTK